MRQWRTLWLTASMNGITYAAAPHRARADFLEMPGLRLTAHQAQRFWMLDAALCHAVLDELVDARFLVRHGRDTFTRVSM
jgi:hypothetical protein